MPIFTWSDSYSVGAPGIDAQHKKLFDMINNLHEAMGQGKGKEALGKILDGLMDYTRVHFSDEEKMLEKVNYPDLAIQKTQHAAFVQKIAELQKDYKSGKITMTLPTMEFLKDWLLNHILVVDKKYEYYVK